VAPKSNAVYKAYKAARAWVKQDTTRPVPMHLRNAPTKLMKTLGHGEGYRYAHDEPNAVAAGERYFPDGMAPQAFYQPVARGLEIKIGDRVAQLRSMLGDGRIGTGEARGAPAARAGAADSDLAASDQDD